MSAQQKPPFDFKTQYGLGFNPQDNEIVVDFFCGGGGGAGTRQTTCVAPLRPSARTPATSSKV